MSGAGVVVLIALLAMALVIVAFLWLLIEMDSLFPPLVAAIAAGGSIVIMLMFYNVITEVVHVLVAPLAS
jgi:hypothetical protein